MGYAHYWEVPRFDTKHVLEGHAKALEIIKDIMARHNQTLDAEKLEEGIIWLDGPCETFAVYRSLAHSGRTAEWEGDDHCSDFCKTAHESYDLPICEALLALAYHVPGFELSSDGFWLDLDFDEAVGIECGLDENWRQALANVRERYGIMFKYSVERRLDTSIGRAVCYREVILKPARRKRIAISNAL